MSSLEKNDDCYFYFYSSCTKGDSCPFRHCEAALGTETVCSLWREGRCYRENCKFRHMESRINRSTIPCYWENQPTGCCKPHCVFMHMKPRPSASSTAEIKKLILPVASGSPPVSIVSHESTIPERTEKQVSVMSSFEEYSDPGENDVHLSPHPVQPFVVRFDEGEESDTESVSSTPMKFAVADLKSSSDSANRNLTGALSEDFGIKTLEQIRMEKIHKESEHFYKSSFNAPVLDSPQTDVNYKPEAYPPVSDFISLSDSPKDNSSNKESSISTDAENDLRNRLLKRKGPSLSKEKSAVSTKKANVQSIKDDDSLNFKIKTLDEIRKEKENKSASKQQKTSDDLTEAQPTTNASKSDPDLLKSARRISLKRKSLESQSKQIKDEDQSQKPGDQSAILHEVQNIAEEQTATVPGREKKRSMDVSSNDSESIKESIQSSISKSNGVSQLTNDVLSATLKIEGRRKLRRPIVRRNIEPDAGTKKESFSNGLHPPARRHSMSPPPPSQKKFKSSAENSDSDFLLGQNSMSFVNSASTAVPSIIVTTPSVIQRTDATLPTHTSTELSPCTDNCSADLRLQRRSVSAPSSPKSSGSVTHVEVIVQSSDSSDSADQKSTTVPSKSSVEEAPLLKKRPSIERSDKRKMSLHSVSEDDIERFLLDETDLALDDVDETAGKDTEALMSEIEQLLES